MGVPEKGSVEGRENQAAGKARDAADRGAGGTELLDLIHTGMTVFDRDGEQVGTVDGVFHGRPEDAAQAAAPASTAGPGSGATPPAKQPADEGAADSQSRAVGSETLRDDAAPLHTPAPVGRSDVDLHDTLSKPPLRRGYLRLGGTDLPEKARFVTADQIERRDDWRVFLKASLAELEAATRDAPD